MEAKNEIGRGQMRLTCFQPCISRTASSQGKKSDAAIGMFAFSTTTRKGGGRGSDDGAGIRSFDGAGTGSCDGAGTSCWDGERMGKLVEERGSVALCGYNITKNDRRTTDVAL